MPYQDVKLARREAGRVPRWRTAQNGRADPAKRFSALADGLPAGAPFALYRHTLFW
jgi:hypothetical protein